METQGRSVRDVTARRVLQNVFIVVAWCLLVTAVLKLLNADGRYTAAGGDSMSQGDAFWLWVRLEWPVHCVAAIVDYVMFGSFRKWALLGITVAPRNLGWILFYVYGDGGRVTAGFGWYLIFLLIHVLGSLFWTFNLYLSSLTVIWPVERIRMALDVARGESVKEGRNAVPITDTIIAFIVGKQRGEEWSYFQHQRFERECRFNPVAARRKYFRSSIAEVPGLVPQLMAHEINRLLLSRRWSRGLVFWR
jgi:hypothetical protein